MLAGLILELAEHVLPALLSELGELAVRQVASAAVWPTTREANASVLSDLPGRLPVRVPEVRSEATRARNLEQQLATLVGIRQAQASALTGSVLVEYDPRLRRLSASTPR
jgi:hypothetical protein